MYFTFHGAECTFHGLEYIFQGVEYTFQPMEHKTETSVKIIQSKCESKCLGEKMRISEENAGIGGYFNSFLSVSMSVI